MTTPSANTPPEKFSPDDAIPQVTAPTVGFLVQLFVVPAVIVSVIIGLWLTVTWLVQDHGDPRQLLVQLRQNTNQRYHAAYKLANVLRGNQHEKLKRDHKFAAELASILNDQIEYAKDDKTALLGEGPVLLRVYIASALGQFHVIDGLDVLIKAATTERDSAEVEVRLGAMQAIAMLTENVRTPLTGNILPETAQLCRQLASDVQSDNRIKDKEKLAEQLDAATQTAARLAKDLRRPGDLARQVETLAEALSQLASNLKRSKASIGGTPIKNIQALAKAMAAQAQQLDRLEWHAGSPLAKMLLRAADERHDKTREDPVAKRAVTYDHLIRLGAAYCLGLIGGPEPIAKLQQMLDDGNSEVRYNGATSLCRHGIASGPVVELLIEMITEPQVTIRQPAGKISAAERGRRIDATRQTVVISALRAIEVLAAENQTDNLSQLSGAVQRLIDSKPLANVRGEAMRIAEHLQRRTAL